MKKILSLLLFCFIIQIVTGQITKTIYFKDKILKKGEKWQIADTVHIENYFDVNEKVLTIKFTNSLSIDRDLDRLINMYNIKPIREA